MKFTLVTFSLVASAVNASFEKISPLAYEPSSKVTDHNAIDLDQAALQNELSKSTDDGFQNARNIYENGGNSKSIAVVKLDIALSSQLTKGTEISGVNNDGETILGKSYGTYTEGVSSITVQYMTSDIQEKYVGCRVGDLTDINIDGCFANNGTLVIGQKTYGYTYDQNDDNNAGRTIQGFSTSAKDKMYECTNCPYDEYEKYYNYYGKHDYADVWVTSAFEGDSTEFKNGNADFSQYGYDGKTQAIKKGTAYMAIYMYVIRELEDAFDDCKDGCVDCNDDPVHAWDEGVAFYTGSTSAELLYALADKRCTNFKTCGTEGNDVSSDTSKVNYDIFTQFSKGQVGLLEGNCPVVAAAKEAVVNSMAIPLIQGALRYAYKVDRRMGGETEMAEGATFAAAILPRVHACSAADAKTIYDNMKVGASSTVFSDVKSAFENNYECMNISCEDVGGLFSVSEYEPDAGPCQGIKELGSVASSIPVTIFGGLASIAVGILALL